MAVILLNYTRARGFTLPKVLDEKAFADNEKISGYAREAVKQMQMAGVLNVGNGNLLVPQGSATRAEVAGVLRRFVEQVLSR